MSGLRVAMITRRFWPLSGSNERMWAGLARELGDLGLVPAIVAARFALPWPAEMTFRELAVHRLSFPTASAWGTMRYMIALARWLRRHHPDIDLAYVSHLSLEAYATLGALAGTGIPVVLRAQSDEPARALRFERWRHVAARVLRRCQTAEAVVTRSTNDYRRLLQSGFDARRIHVIPDGVSEGAAYSPADKASARAALCAVNEDLRVGGDVPVVTYIGPLQAQLGLGTLVDAWRVVSRQHPLARLWLVGDGAQRHRLLRHIQSADLYGRVLLPGTFDDVEDVIRASDLLVVPAPGADESVTILEAMVGGLSVLVADAPQYDNLVRNNVTGRRIQPRDPRTLADAILAGLAEPQRGAAMAAAACAYVRQHHSLRDMACRHLELFSTLVHSASRTVS